ncbi:hypothetical protein [Mucilaginibacter mallensis]|uniref:hypothetical protein n=1 Tax=Mucilaginibacter mallensis TaxID=652787 RepID=UPI000B875738|nr:hypothetical protein [Mucilaginibacter mallensis]
MAKYSGKPKYLYNKSKFIFKGPFIPFGKAGQIFGKQAEKGGKKAEKGGKKAEYHGCRWLFG